MKFNNIMILGFGPHARNIYIPCILEMGNKSSIKIKSLVALKSEKRAVFEYFELSYSKKLNFITESLFIDPIQDTLSNELKKTLNTIVRKHNIKAVIISTEPSSHKAFALWALENNLHIGMDKPITTVKNAANDIKSAINIYNNYQELYGTYIKKRKEKNILFSLNTPRRFHPGFNFIFSKIAEIKEKTNCPITSMQIGHGDGQWRMPNETVDMEYHGYNHGYGKNSHSGYHLFDLIAQFLKVGTPDCKQPDSVEIFSSQIKPFDYLHQINLSDYNQVSDYNKAFGKDYENKYTEKEIFDLCKNYGEIDSFSQMHFKKNQATICTIQLTLLHNSCSQRAWSESRRDLFRGYGRVKHESMFIQQGPFQCIQLNSYQNKLPINENPAKDHEIGGVNHFDVWIYRNARLLGGKICEKFSIDQLIKPQDMQHRVLIVAVKKMFLKELFDYILKNKNPQKLLSEFTTHKLGTFLMSSAYEAAVRKELIKKHLSKDHFYSFPHF